MKMTCPNCREKFERGFDIDGGDPMILRGAVCLSCDMPFMIELGKPRVCTGEERRHILFTINTREDILHIRKELEK